MKTKKDKTKKDVHESRAVITPADQVEIDDSMIEKINQYTLTPLTKADVYVRSMYIVNDQVDSYCSKFTPETLTQIASLLPGESVLKGHDNRGLPIARFFDAVVTQKPGSEGMWVRAWFYWLKETEGGADMARNIDGGVYREVSLSWRYKTSKCSICGENIWNSNCPHVPGDEYEGKVCYYEMSDIVEVLEGSLVFKGGQIGTELAGVRAKGAPVELPANKEKIQEEGSDKDMTEERVRELETQNTDLVTAKDDAESRAEKLQAQVETYRKAINKDAVAALRFSSAAQEALKLVDHLNGASEQESKALRAMLVVIDTLAVEGRLIDKKSVERMTTPEATELTPQDKNEHGHSETMKRIAHDVKEEQKGGK